MDVDSATKGFQARFDAKMAARERALPAARQAIRNSANAIRAIHRHDYDRAGQLMDQAGAHVAECFDACRLEPEIRYAGYVQDAEKELAEARLTYAMVRGENLPSPNELGIEVAPYLNGMSEAIGEGRRQVLDLLREGENARAEALLQSMDDMYGVLVSIDYPDAITGNLRRSTDVARSILERTRGDLTMSTLLSRHAKEVAHGV